GLALSTRRFDIAKNILRRSLELMRNGIIPNHSLDYDYPEEKPRYVYEGADITLWWAWALYHYWQVVRDREFVEEVFGRLVEAGNMYASGGIYGVSVDRADGLLRCADKKKEFTWMDAKVEGIPITPRPGKAVEICSLWYNFLETIRYFKEKLELDAPGLEGLLEVADLARASMAKFWNEDRKCLYDVIETGVVPTGKNDDS
ncbi:MAG TPA: amylo-alpha-1,6-glucosidase, partial [Candidatus Melainabacteria bacterium]|nr:amylo-alpha-1,6-glucosidase [Candidatus Melainabacteria bacterium]